MLKTSRCFFTAFFTNLRNLDFYKIRVIFQSFIFVEIPKTPNSKIAFHFNSYFRNRSGSSTIFCTSPFSQTQHKCDSLACHDLEVESFDIPSGVVFLGKSVKTMAVVLYLLLINKTSGKMLKVGGKYLHACHFRF